MAKSKRKKKQNSRAPKIIVVIVLVVIIALIATGAYLYVFKRDVFDDVLSRIERIFGVNDGTSGGDNTGASGGGKENVIVNGELSIHFLEPGNANAGDCVYIKAGEADILVDAGSRKSSVSTIKKYLDDYVKDGVLEYVIATHADTDHIAGFAASDGIFSLYECKTIIDFARTNKTTDIYNEYVLNRQAEETAGAKHYTALDCVKETNGAKKTYDITAEISITFLYQEFYEKNSADENNYSVCFMLKHGERNFLFTGDLEEAGEKSLVKSNDLPEVELFKAGHHGSKTSSNDVLLSVIKPKIVCVCCCAGSVEYTQNLENTFPTQAFIDRVAKYTDRVYVTTVMPRLEKNDKDRYVNTEYELLNGNIAVVSDKEGVTVKCSHSDTLLKDTEWFKNNRTCPEAWKTAA